MNSSSTKPLTYAQAGVDIDAGARLVERIKPAVARTRRPEVLAGLGGFGALFALPPGKYLEPVLVSGTDGVGTKLKLAQQWKLHETIGIDLVGMCVNDVLVQGAEALFFLDYFACGKLDVDTASTVINGIAKGCELAGCALVGGETAEMPDMYAPGEYDLAGFCVGAVERARLLDGARVAQGDQILGIASSGPHSNGYSLIRRVLERAGAAPDDLLDGQSLAHWLMAPTAIYVKPLLRLLEQQTVHALAHITGGGLKENIIRVVPDHLGIFVDTQAWPRPGIFNWLKTNGSIDESEMLRTFNCGIGMTVIVPAHAAASTQANLAALGLEAWPIGVVEQATGAERVRFR